MRIFIILSTLFFVMINIGKAQLSGKAKIDSLLKELPNAKQDTNHVNLLADLSLEYYSIDPDKGIEYAEKGLELAKKLNWKKGEAQCYNSLGGNNIGKSNYPKALEFYHKALKINQELGDKSSVALNLGNIGVFYMNQSDYPKALEFYQKALKINEELGNKSGVARYLGNIGVIYANQPDNPKALELFHKALKINEELGNKSGAARNLGNIGAIYMNQSDYPKALEYYHKAQKINEELGRKSNIANNLGNIGSLYLKQAQDSLIQNSENKLDLTINKENSLNKAIEYSKNAIDIFKEIGELHKQSSILSNLSDAYKLKGDYKKAFETFIEHAALQDSVFSMEKQKEIANLDAKRENEIKDKEIVILQTEQKAQQFQSYLLAGGLIVLFGAFGIAFIRFREKKKLSDQLAKQKSEIESKNSLLEVKNTEIVDSINYAATIQNALLPWASVLNNNFKEHFVIYKPKDIVSGDSYWFQEVDGIKYLAVIDCTGHGVPGSMLTVIANSVLDDAVLSKKLTSTSEILTYMNAKVTEVLNQRLAENSIRDGMEVALIAIHHNKIQFSGAGRPLFIKNGKLETLKTDKRGIAGQNDNDTYNYSSVEIEKTDNLILYLSSDGYADQMNENSKKYSTKRFLEILDRIAELPLEQQKEILENEFNSHKGNREQIDDVTVIGIRI